MNTTLKEIIGDEYAVLAIKYFISGFYYGMALLSLLLQFLLWKILHTKKLLFNLLLFISILICFISKDLYTLNNGYTLDLTSRFLISWNMTTTLILLILLPFPFLNYTRRLKFYKISILILGALLITELLTNILLVPNSTTVIYHSLITIVAIFSIFLFYLLYHKYNHNWHALFILGCVLTTSFLMSYFLSNQTIDFMIKWPIVRLFSLPLIIINAIMLFQQIQKLYNRKNSFKKASYQYLYFVRDYHKRLIQFQKEHHQFSEVNQSEKINIEYFLKNTFNLTEREIEVLNLIWEGNTNQQIADSLYISLNTAKYHIRNIYEKLNINSRNQAYIIEKEIINNANT
ncbi:response regulator transcription factor [Myroides pelagicus]|uniref:HTH luxR-type domain-containing protein n=1 Tax=Myroides pelagicus TaxID=270914 RepID=A0A7K1GNR4_9FLAO|nr:helix-turn-helix transcriptional regulator [Myroides pelagicus]MEC4113871.1 helix-turn-helix transcriptional regulator [Myroides pelagicus]MTH30428.1 hypothetical protein [Myroides pelagicus]